MKDIIILGAGENGQMVVEIVEEINERNKTLNIIGFLDDDPEKFGIDVMGVPVIGKIQEVSQYKKCFFTSPLITGPKTNYRKKLLVDKLALPLESYINIIHPSIRQKYLKIGNGNLVTANSTIMHGVEIGNHCYISSNVLLGPLCKIYDYVNISNSTSIQGKVKIFEGSYIGAASSVIGMNEIGKWSIIGMGSNVIRKVDDFEIVAGNPSRLIGYNKIDI